MRSFSGIPVGDAKAAYTLFVVSVNVVVHLLVDSRGDAGVIFKIFEEIFVIGKTVFDRDILKGKTAVDKVIFDLFKLKRVDVVFKSARMAFAKYSAEIILVVFEIICNIGNFDGQIAVYANPFLDFGAKLVGRC